jgi:hypothetical protein
VGPDRAGVVLGFDKRDELWKEHFLTAHLETQGFAQTHVGHQLRV